MLIMKTLTVGKTDGHTRELSIYEKGQSLSYLESD